MRIEFVLAAEIEDVFVAGERHFELYLIGESGYQKHIGFLARNDSRGGCDGDLIARLHYEYGNPHDGNAIRVVVSGGTVGYLSQEDSRRFRERIAQAGLKGIIVSCDALITGGKRTGLFKKSEFRVCLDLPIAKL